MSFTLSYTGSQINKILKKADAHNRWYQHHITFYIGTEDNDCEIYYLDTDATKCVDLDQFKTIRSHPNYIFGHCRYYKFDCMIIDLSPTDQNSDLITYYNEINEGVLRPGYIVLKSVSGWNDDVTEI